VRTTLVLCDLDGEDARRPGVAVVEMSLEGVGYPLDVCDEHLAILRSLPKLDTVGAVDVRSAARGVHAGRTPPTGRPGKTASAGRPVQGGQRRPGSRRERQERVARAREWARAQGRDVADRGRLPAGLLDEFEDATR